MKFHLSPPYPPSAVEANSYWFWGVLLGNSRLNSEKTVAIRKHEPHVTWPSRELGSRISPDRQWISFLSNQGGRTDIWLRNMSGGDPMVIKGTPRFATLSRGLPRRRAFCATGRAVAPVGQERRWASEVAAWIEPVQYMIETLAAKLSQHVSCS